MAYIEWADVAEVVEGEKRLQTILLPHVETEDEHPHFDEHVEVAQGMIDSALHAGGYTTPLAEPLADTVLKRAGIGVVVGLITQAKSNREPWMDRLEQFGLKHLKKIEKGEAQVIGADVLDSGDEAFEEAIYGTKADVPTFDSVLPDVGINDVFADLDLRRSRRG